MIYKWNSGQVNLIDLEFVIEFLRVFSSYSVQRDHVEQLYDSVEVFQSITIKMK